MVAGTTLCLFQSRQTAEQVIFKVDVRTVKGTLPCDQNVIVPGLSAFWQQFARQFSQAALSPVSLNGIADFFAGGKSDADPVIRQPTRPTILTFDNLNDKPGRGTSARFGGVEKLPSLP